MYIMFRYYARLFNLLLKFCMSIMQINVFLKLYISMSNMFSTFGWVHFLYE